MTHMPQLSRRSFVASVAALGGGLALGFHLPTDAGSARAAEGAAEVNAWIVIQPDDTVVIRVARSEMGQGITTALPMLVAEELECDWSKVRAEFPTADENLRAAPRLGRHVDRRQSVGPDLAGIPAQGRCRGAGDADRCRRAAMECRRRRVSGGKQRHHPQAERPHAALWRGRRSRRETAAAGRAKAQGSEGLDARRNAAKAPRHDGQGDRKADLRHRCPRAEHALCRDRAVSGLWRYAQIIRRSQDPRPQRRSPGRAAAERGGRRCRQLVAGQAGDRRPAGDLGRRAERQGLERRASPNCCVAGSPRRRPRWCARTAMSKPHSPRRRSAIEAEYAAPYLAHATMEPMNCTAHVTADKVEVWVPTQSGEGALAAAAAAAEMAPEKVVLHKTMLGGGFGRRGAVQDYVHQAVLIAKAVGQPVKLLWTREEDTRHDFYRPAAMVKLTAGLDASGMPIAWRVRLTSPSIFAVLLPQRLSNGVDQAAANGFTDEMAYDVPNYRVEYAMRTTHVPVGFWRSVNHSQNGFFRGVLYRRDGACRGPGPLPVPPQAAEQEPEAARRARRGGAEGGVGQAGAAGRLPRHCAGRGLRQPVRAGRRGFGRRQRPGAECSGSWPRSIPAMSSTRRSFSRRSRAASSMASPRRSMARSRSRTVASSQGNFDDYEMLRMADMPTVETVLVPTRRVLGRRRRAGGAAAGAGAVQRDLRGDRQAHSLTAAEGSGPQSGVSSRGERGALAVQRARLIWLRRSSCGRAAARGVVLLGLSSGERQGRHAGAADRRARAGGDRRGDAGLSQRRAPIDGHGPDRQGVLRRRDPGDRGLATPRSISGATVMRTTRRGVSARQRARRLRRRCCRARPGTGAGRASS